VLLDCVADDVFYEPVDPKRLAAYLAEPNNLMSVAVAGDSVVGQCATVITGIPDKPTELYVDERSTTVVRRVVFTNSRRGDRAVRDAEPD
jgi:hypothetical protein